MSFLSDSNKAQIVGIIQRVLTEFANESFKVLKKVQPLDLYGEQGQNYTEYNLTGFLEWKTKEVKQGESGTFDDSDGMITVDYKKMLDLSLVSGQEVLLEPNTDKVVYGGVRYLITQATTSPALKGTHLAVYLKFKKML